MEEEGVNVPQWVKDMLANGHTSFYKRRKQQVYYYDQNGNAYVQVEDNPKVIQPCDVKRKKPSSLRKTLEQALSISATAYES